MTIFLLGIIIIVGLIFIIKAGKEVIYYKKELNNLTNKYHDEIIKNKDIQDGLLANCQAVTDRNEIRKSILEEELQTIKLEAQNSYADYRHQQFEKIDLEIANKRYQLERAMEKEVDEYAENIARERGILATIIPPLQEERRILEHELEDLKSKRAALNEAVRREQEVANNREFHSIDLNKNDLMDIEYLLELKGRLRCPALLSKLIWSEYIQKPTKEMIDRVVGGKVCGIYKITSTTTKVAYIGQSVDIASRWINHIKTALGADGGAAHTKFHDVLARDGIENFTFEILEKCKKEKLNEREKYYIDFYETNKYGLNSTKGGS